MKVGLRFSLLGFFAGIAYFVVDTNCAATVRAFPFFLLVIQELFDTLRLNVIQILNCAHSILISVMNIECFQVCAWKVCAFKTILNLFSC